MKTTLFMLFTSICIIGYSQDNISIKLIKQKHLTDLPSASGVEYINGSIYVIGDDSPFLYTLDNNFSIIDKLLITGNDSMPNGRVPKAIKSDFESMAAFSKRGNTYILVLSSGSKKITRDTIHLISIKENRVIKSKNIRPLYEEIRKKAGLSDSDDINFEALAINNSSVFMLQRGNNNENLVIAFSKRDFMRYVKKKNSQIPEFSITRFNLPELENTIAGFSGVCILPDNSGLLFTASLEATSNAYDDGEILGSYIGWIKFDDFKKDLSTTKLIMVDDKVLKTKLEGICVKSVENNKTSIITVSDNDDGTSWVYEMDYYKTNK